MPDDFSSGVPRATDHQTTQPFASPEGVAHDPRPARPRAIQPPPDPLVPRHYPDRVEVKLDYAIDTKRRHTHYRIETYFFVPRTLGLDVHTYSRDEFFTDNHASIRFKEPRIPSSVLANPRDPGSPLCQACEMIRQANGRLETLSADKLSYELRLFGCIVRTNLRDVAIDMHHKIQRLDSPGAQSVLAQDVRQGLVRLLHDVDAQLRALRDTRATFFQPKRPPWLSELFEYVDEYVGLSAESCLTSVLIHLDAHPGLRATQGDLRDQIVARIVAEQHHRKSAGYAQSLIDPAGENRSRVYRTSALKKFMSSVLYLDIRKEKEGRGITNVMAGLAAAVAMAFSTVAAIWSQGTYGLNSFPFVLAMVIGYVFKDRIKEWLRTYFSGLVSRRLYDYSMHIQDPNTKTVLGRCRESFEFVPASQVPADIVRYRHCDSKSVLEPETKPEVVMKYVKDVTLWGRRIAKLRRSLTDIRDINRLNVSRLLIRMNEPRQVVATYSPDRDEVIGVSCPKSYHVNLVVVRTADEEPTTTARYRVLLDKHGVRSMQPVVETSLSVESSLSRP